MNSTTADPRPALRYWSSEAVRDHVSLSAAVQVIREACLSADAVDQPPRLSLGEGRLLVMAARRDGDGDSVVKVVKVNTHGQPSPAHPSVRGLVVGLDGDGDGVWVADAGALTLLRTAAMVSLATDILAPAHARRLAILGAGRQGREHVSAAALVRDICEVSIWNRTPARAEALAADLADLMPAARIQVCRSPESAVSNADIVCCATAATAPLFAAGALPSEVHVNAIGSYRPDMYELPGELLSDASIVAVDDLDACLLESGEIIDAVRKGLDVRTLVPLPELLAQPPQRHGQTVFKSVGMAIADLAVSRLLAPTPSSEHAGAIA